jgi:hypothetical protein
LYLNLFQLARQGFVWPGEKVGPSGIAWTNTYTGEKIASGHVTADLTAQNQGWFRIQLGNLDQRITLIARPRYFGGHQWFFVCPYMNRRASVLWMPPGARDFACRQEWGRQVAYASQFETPIDRAHRGQAKISSWLCAVGGFDPKEWDYPPKPKWMRWNTYNRAIKKFDCYEDILDQGTCALVAKLSKLGWFAR